MSQIFGIKKIDGQGAIGWASLSKNQNYSVMAIALFELRSPNYLSKQ